MPKSHDGPLASNITKFAQSNFKDTSDLYLSTRLKRMAGKLNAEFNHKKVELPH